MKSGGVKSGGVKSGGVIVADSGVRPMRILFISSNRVGDAVLTCGVLDYLIRTHPACRITIACGPVAAGVFERMPNRERTILVTKRSYDRHWLTLWREVVLTVWDLVVDMRGSLLAFVVPTRRRAVRRRVPGRMFEQYAAALGVTPAPLPVVWTAAADHARAAGLLPHDRPVLALGATANWAPKIWPAERFAALVRLLAEGPLPGVVPAVFAGPGEAERQMAAPLLEALPDAIDLRGTLSIAEAAACIERSALFVGNDSGLMHLAAATGVATVGLCGPTMDRAVEMAPIGRRASWAMADSASMKSLSVETAYAACLDMLGGAPGQLAQLTRLTV